MMVNGVNGNMTLKVKKNILKAVIEQTNIKIQNKQTNKIIYDLDLYSGFWTKSEYDSRGQMIDWSWGQ